MERSHIGAGFLAGSVAHAEAVHSWRTVPHGKDPHVSSSEGQHPTGEPLHSSGEQHEGEGAAQMKHYGLSITPIPHPPCTTGRQVEGSGMKE